MTVRVAVVDPLPMFARGLIETLHDEGYSADAPDDIMQWIQAPGSPVVLLSVANPGDWELLAGLLRDRPDAVVVAVIAEIDHDVYVRAVAAGAVGVLPKNASETTVRDVVRAAAGGHSLLPVDVLRSLVAGTSHAEAPRPISDDEAGWLRRLADGETVAQLAARVGYSERMMFRLLSDVYHRLGAGNRTKALMRARDEGWL